jgi:formylglycine-generating enzyme required for sulfatase activity
VGASCGDATSCCASKVVPGGAFNRRNSAQLKATVSPFELDVYEVTVGRFRAFMASRLGTKAMPPAAGSGAHPRIAGSGWRAIWNDLLPADTAALRGLLAGGTWTDAAATNEQKPITNTPWLVGFAFCAWDGGRLPTYAEWTFAAAGGDEQRVYPWSSPPTSTTINGTLAAYNCNATAPAYTCPQSVCSVGGASPCVASSCLALLGTCQQPPCFGCDASKDVAKVGSVANGGARWGHLDLSGNVAEYVLDSTKKGASVPTFPPTCADCAPLMGDRPQGTQVGGNDDFEILILGGAWNELSAVPLRTTEYEMERYSHRANDVGFRCARD